jgi:hypothetical protein
MMTSRPNIARVSVALAAVALLCGAASAQQQPDQPRVFVPYSDIAAVLGTQNKSVLMDRAEFAALLAAAKASGADRAPQVAQAKTALYRAQVEARSLELHGALTVVSAAPGPVAMPLGLGQMGLTSVTLDGKPAPLGYDDRGGLLLIVTGSGEHKLEFQASSLLRELPTGGMELGLSLPQAAAAQMELRAPGDLSIHATAPVSDRVYDAAADATAAKLTLGGMGRLTAVLMGNGRQDDQRALLLGEFATSVEVSAHSQVLRAACTVQALRRGVRELRLSLDDSWTVTDVSCPTLVKWSVAAPATAPADGRQTLLVQLRDVQRGTVALNIRAVSGLENSAWRSPRIVLEDAAYQRGYLLVDAQSDLRVRKETLVSARREDPAASAAAARVLGATGGRLYYHWGQDWSVAMELARAESGATCREKLVLSVGASELSLEGRFEITAVGRELHEVTLLVPPRSSGWVIDGASEGEGEANYDVSEQAQGRKVTIRLQSPLRADKSVTVGLHMAQVPQQWRWDVDSPPREITVQLPAAQCGAVRGAVGVSCSADLDAEELAAPEYFVPMPVGRMTEAGFSELIRSAWSYELATDSKAQPPSLSLRIVRRQPRLSAASLGLLSVSSAQVRGDWRMEYLISRASTDVVYLLAGKSLESNLRIAVTGYRSVAGEELAQQQTLPRITAQSRVASGAKTVELSPELSERYELWQVTFDQPLLGVLTLEAGYTRSLQGQYEPPLLRPVGVGQSSEMLAIEGQQDLGVSVSLAGATDMDAIDLPPLPRPASRIISAMRLSSASTPAGAQAAVKLSTTVHEPYGVAPAIARQVDMVTHLGADGSQRTALDMQLANAALQFLTFALPAKAELWSVAVDGKPARPGRTPGGESYAVALPRNRQAMQVRIVYAVAPGGGGHCVLLAPRINDIKIARTTWSVIAPPNCDIKPLDDLMSFTSLRKPTGPAIAGWADAASGAMCREGRSLMRAAAAPREDREVNPDPWLAPSSAPASQPAKHEAVLSGLYRSGRSAMPVTLTGEDSPTGEFSSLGAPPAEMRLMLAPRNRAVAWAWLGAALVLLAGMFMRRRRTRVLLVLGVAFVATLGAIWWPLAADLFNGAFYASVALAGLYLLWGLGRGFARHFGRPSLQSAAAALLAAMLTMVAPAIAGAPASQPTSPGAEAPAVVVPYEGDPTKANQSTKVLVSYERFVELWNASHPDDPIEMPPAGSRVSVAGATAQVEITSERVELTLRAQVAVQGKQAAMLPMPFAGVAVESAQFAGKPAPLRAGVSGMVLALEGGSSGELVVRALGVPKLEGRRGEANFSIPPLPAAVMTVRLPSEDLELDAPGIEGALSRKTVAGGAEWTVPLGLRRDVKLRWSPRAGRGGADKTLTAAATHDVYVYHWGAVGMSQFAYSFSGGEHDSFALLVPPGVTVTDVTGPNVREFVAAQQDGGASVVSVKLYRPAAKDHQLRVKWLCRLGWGTVALPLPEALDVGRESGTVTLHAGGGVSLKVTSASGGRRSDMPAAGASPSGELASPVARYVWAYRPFALELQVSAIEARAAAQLEQLVRLTPQGAQAMVRATISSTQGRLFGADFALPDGYELVGALGMAVESTYVQSTTSGRLLHVNFRSGVGATSLSLVLSRTKPPTGEFDVPVVRAVDSSGAPLADQKGQLAVQIASSLDAQTISALNMRAIAPSALAGLLGSPQQVQAVRFAYEYEKASAALRISVQPKPTRLELEHTVAVSVGPAAANYAYRLRYNIDGSPVDRVSFALPERYAPLAAVSSPSMRSVRAETQDGMTRWTVFLTGEITGLLDLTVNFALPIDADTTELEVPQGQWGKLDRYQAMIFVQNFAAHRLSAQPSEGLTEMQAQRQSAVTDAQSRKALQYAFEAHRADWSLKLGVTPAKDAKRIGAVIDQMAVVTAVDVAGNVRHKVTMTLQNRREQFLRVRLGGSELWSASVAGQQVKAMAGGQKDEVLIPLIKTSPGGLPYDVVLVLEGQAPHPGGAVWQVQPAPVRVVGVDVMRTTWSLRLPEGYRYVKHGGNMDPVLGEAELNKLAADTMIEQLKRLEEYASSGESSRSKKIAVDNLKVLQTKAKKAVERNSEFIRSNSYSLGNNAARLERESNSQYGLLEAWSGKIASLEKKLDEQSAVDLTNWANNTAANGGTFQSQRDGQLDEAPAFVRRSLEEQKLGLATAVKQAQNELPTQPQRPADMLDEKDQRQQAQLALNKLREEQADKAAKRQVELQKELSLLDDLESRLQMGGGGALETQGHVYYAPARTGQRAGQQEGKSPGQRPQDMPMGAKMSYNSNLGQQVTQGNAVLNADGTIQTGGEAFEQPAAPLAEAQQRLQSFADQSGDGWLDVPASDGGMAYVAHGTVSLPADIPEEGPRVDFVRNGPDAELAVLLVRESLVSKSSQSAWLVGAALVALLLAAGARRLGGRTWKFIAIVVVLILATGSALVIWPIVAMMLFLVAIVAWVLLSRRRA